MSPHAEFVKKVIELSNQNVFLCYQCGKCSAGCPVEGDLLPNQVVRLIQLNDEKVLASTTIWLCLSCFLCTVRCPKKLDLAKIMDTLRTMNLRKNVDYYNIEATRKLPDGIPPMAIIGCYRKFTSL